MKTAPIESMFGDYSQSEMNKMVNAYIGSTTKATMQLQPRELEEAEDWIRLTLLIVQLTNCERVNAFSGLVGSKATLSCLKRQANRFQRELGLDCKDTFAHLKTDSTKATVILGALESYLSKKTTSGKTSLLQAVSNVYISENSRERNQQHNEVSSESSAFDLEI